MREREGGTVREGEKGDERGIKRGREREKNETVDQSTRKTDASATSNPALQRGEVCSITCWRTQRWGGGTPQPIFFDL